MRYYLSLGSNLGDREHFLRAGIAAIAKLPNVAVGQASEVFDSPAMYLTDQPSFLNVAVVVDAEMEPLDMLRALQEVESEFGRQRAVRFGPRTLDIDIIAIDDGVIDLPDLQVPHPRMHERPFVVVPLAEIAPDWLHPALGLSAAQLASQLTAREEAS